MDAKAQELQYNINNDIATPIKLGKRTFKVKYLKEWTANTISVLIAKKNITIKGDNTMESLAAVNSLPSKVLSMAILGTRWKIFFFHAIFWRYIRDNFTPKEISEALEAITEKMQLAFFLRSMVLIESMNQLKIQLTKEEALSYQAELVSGRRQTS